MLNEKQKEILSEFDGADRSNWNDWRWQIKHCIHNLESFENLLDIKLPENIRDEFSKITATFPMSVTPYYLSLINTDDLENDPVFKQSFPAINELVISKADMDDPLHEDRDSPVEGLTHRYPDRALLLVSNCCSMYCRHCTRKRMVGDVESIPAREQIMKGIDYVRSTPRIRDVLLSGGDPFLLSDDYLDWILTELKKN